MYFNDNQIQAFKELHNQGAIKADLWLAIQLLFYCFIRPNEIRFLQAGDINLEERFIELRSEISKNQKTQRVSIPTQLLEQLSIVQHLKPKSFLIGKDGFGSQTPVSSSYLNREHSKVLKHLKIQGRYSIYSWKHTGCVKAVRAGINIKDIQLQLRHHSLDMVNEYLKNLGVLDSEDLKYNFPSL